MAINTLQAVVVKKPKFYRSKPTIALLATGAVAVILALVTLVTYVMFLYVLCVASFYEPARLALENFGFVKFACITASASILYTVFNRYKNGKYRTKIK